MTQQPITIAIDGLAATGKGTLARRLAEALGFAYLDTGLLYRAVGASLILSGVNPSDGMAAIEVARELTDEKLAKLSENPLVRSAEGGQAASKVAEVQGVRDALFSFQVNFSKEPPAGAQGAVLDGRDIGTVIAPDALVKIFVEATPEIRANRRFLELQARGENVTEAQVLNELRERDLRDASRRAAPAKAAEDAIHLDTTHLNADEVFEKALALVRAKMGQA